MNAKYSVSVFLSKFTENECCLSPLYSTKIRRLRLLCFLCIIYVNFQTLFYLI